jgi:hypothetical protein
MKIASTRYLLILLIVGVASLYIQYYTSYVKNFQLLQSKLDTITIDTLYERQPVIIQDRIVDPLQLLKTLFKWNYMFQNMIHITPSMYDSSKIVKTNHKYSVVYSQTSDITVQLIHPRFHNDVKPFQRVRISPSSQLVISSISLQDSQVEYVTVKLKKQQCLILPMLWLYQTHNEHNVMVLDDPLSYIIGHMY